MVERTLNMKFKNVNGGSFNFAIKDLKENIEDSEVSAAMESIIADDVFISKDGELVSKVSAEIVSKETTELTL